MSTKNGRTPNHSGLQDTIGAPDAHDGSRPYLKVRTEDDDLVYNIYRSIDSGLSAPFINVLERERVEGDIGYYEILNNTAICAPSFLTFAQCHQIHMDRLPRFNAYPEPIRFASILITMSFFDQYRQDLQVERMFLKYFGFSVEQKDREFDHYLAFQLLAARSYIRAGRPEFALAILHDCLARTPNSDTQRREKLAVGFAEFIGLRCPMGTLADRVRQLNERGAGLLPLPTGPKGVAGDSFFIDDVIVGLTTQKRAGMVGIVSAYRRIVGRGKGRS